MGRSSSELLSSENAAVVVAVRPDTEDAASSSSSSSVSNPSLAEEGLRKPFAAWYWCTASQDLASSDARALTSDLAESDASSSSRNTSLHRTA